jgi:hypothetical protein
VREACRDGAELTDVPADREGDEEAADGRAPVHGRTLRGVSELRVALTVQDFDAALAF